MKQLNKLEKKILKFIDKKTWDKEHPKKVKLWNDGNIGRAKIRWTKIRFTKEEFIPENPKRFTKNDVKFNKALNNLKSLKLITSRTKCQLYAGLTSTKKGHELILKK